MAGPRRRLAQRARGRGAARRAADRRPGGGRGVPRPAACGGAARTPGRPDRVDRRASASSSRAAIERAGIANARVVCERSESWAAAPPPDGGREAYDAVTARAVGRLSTLAELASPLLARGRRARRLEGPPGRGRGGGARARRRARWRWSRSRSAGWGRTPAPRPPPARAAQEWADPGELPRRPGMAKKRPLGGR